MTRSLFALALLLSTLACGEPPEAAAPPPRLDAPGAAPGPREGPPSEPADTPAAAALALEGEGLRLFLVPSGAARPIPFGTPKAATLEALRAALPAPPREQGENADCAAGYATWANGLTVWFSGEEFSGWFVGEGGEALTTASGVGPGSTRAELEASYAVQVAPSSLGIEFTAGGLAGLLTSSGPDAEVAVLWAGHACLAR